MASKAIMEQISRQTNGSAVAVWGRYLLRTAYQPIFSFVEGKVKTVAYEGLIRPFDDGYPISPGEFFASVKVADRLSVETLTRSLHVMNATQVIGPGHSLFLNFDPSVFVDRSIADAALSDMRASLYEASIDPARVVCELTEQKSGSDEVMHRFVAALRAAGFRIAIDDFGADDSDYSRVVGLKPDIIKFDAQWIVRLMETSAGQGLLELMVGKFKSMGFLTLFEGLEETWQVDLAVDCKVDMVQGYALAMPEIVGQNNSADLTFEQPKIVGEWPNPVASRAPVAMRDVARPARAFGRRVAAP